MHSHFSLLKESYAINYLQRKLLIKGCAIIAYKGITYLNIQRRMDMLQSSAKSVRIVNYHNKSHSIIIYQMQGNIEPDFYFFQGHQIQTIALSSYEYLQQYREQCYSRGLCLGFSDCQRIQKKTRQIIQQCKSCRTIFTNRIRSEENNQSYGDVQDDVVFQNVGFRLPPNQIEPQADQQSQLDQGQFNSYLNDQNSLKSTLNQQQPELSQNEKQTASAKGYIIREGIKDIGQKKHPQLKNLCNKYGNGYKYESLVRFCKNQIKNTKKYYIPVKLFLSQLSKKNCVRALILIQFFVQYLEHYDASKTRTQKKVYYINCGKSLRKKIISIQKKKYSEHSQE